MWSHVQNKDQQRWLWRAIDHATGKVLAYALGPRKDSAFKRLKTLLQPFGITQFLTDEWGAYLRHLDLGSHFLSKRLTQKIERKHLTLRPRIKRLARKTLCFSTSTLMHDTVIGLFINRIEFSLRI